MATEKSTSIRRHPARPSNHLLRNGLSVDQNAREVLGARLEKQRGALFRARAIIAVAAEGLHQRTESDPSLISFRIALEEADRMLEEIATALEPAALIEADVFTHEYELAGDSAARGAA